MIVNENIVAILRAFLNLQKKFMKNSTLAATEFPSKIPNRKKKSNAHFNLCEAEISLDILKNL